MSNDAHAMLVPLSDSDLTLASVDDDVRGRTVIDRNGDEVGEIDDLLIDPEERRVRFLQVGSGGFLGIGENKQLIPVDAVIRVGDSVHIEKPREDVAGAPVYDPSLVQELGYFDGIYGYYGYPPYWAPGYVYPGFPYA